MKQETKNTPPQNIWDLAVIGGGPAGMMAASRAAECGAKVVLLEKNDTLGKKLLITGGGRCNVTNAEFDTRKFLSKFKGNDKFLFSAFSQRGVKETLDFFHAHDMPTKVEAENRVFPKSNSAKSVWDVLARSMKDNGVTLLSRSPVAGFVKKGNEILAVRCADGKEIKAKAFVLATGGMSRPETGSTGDGFVWLKKSGIPSLRRTRLWCLLRSKTPGSKNSRASACPASK
ncbi:aminoacetone oxidase family FAD-binding enzyme [Candidatus Azambacteria bacterium]|nr:aminoacetone oxidase family FAD-binding enzyme [Candidatus Azambacteria bacterium]MBI3684849.1 aminoacetone oxidase family FAD-binding enzyme [Candidatus Azambacteria bacterium]